MKTCSSLELTVVRFFASEIVSAARGATCIMFSSFVPRRWAWQSRNDEWANNGPQVRPASKAEHRRCGVCRFVATDSVTLPDAFAFGHRSAIPAETFARRGAGLAGVFCPCRIMSNNSRSSMQYWLLRRRAARVSAKHQLVCVYMPAYATRDRAIFSMRSLTRQTGRALE